MVNLFARLGVRPDADTVEIQKAITLAAQRQSVSLEELQKCKEWLLDPKTRAQYTQKLYAENPEVLTGLMTEIARTVAREVADKAVAAALAQQAKPAETAAPRNGRRRKQSDDLHYGFRLKKLIILVLSVIGALSIFLPWYSVPIIGSLNGSQNTQAWFSFAAFTVIALTMILTRASAFDGRTKIGMTVLALFSFGGNILVRQAILDKLNEKSAEMENMGKFGEMAANLAAAAFKTEFGFYLNVGMGVIVLLVLFLMQED